MLLPLLAASDWGIAIGIGVILLLFLIVGYVIIQGTRVQLYWRKQAEAGDIEAIRTLVGDELTRWKTARTPKDVAPAVWHGVQSLELLDVWPDGVRLSASAEGQYALVGSERREVSSLLKEAMKLTSRLEEMVMYDVPNVKLAHAQIDVYSTYRDQEGSSQRCIMSTDCRREVADQLDWDGLDAEDIVHAFGGRYSLDDRGNPLPVAIEERTSGVPAAFYKDD